MAKLKRVSKTERQTSAVRADRAMSNRSVSENRELTDAERLDMFRRSMFQSSLPDLPKIPGFHTCWLTTSNPRDSIQARLRIGYQLIKAAEIPGWEHASIKSADYVGCIGVNEMVAAKLPNHLYEAYMQEAHHYAPLHEEEKLTYAAQDTVEKANQASKSGTASIYEVEDGTEGLGKAPRVPTFVDETED
jgi:hypothetical protein